MPSTEIKINGKKDVLQHFFKFTSVLYFTWLSQFKYIKTKEKNIYLKYQFNYFKIYN